MQSNIAGVKIYNMHVNFIKISIGMVGISVTERTSVLSVTNYNRPNLKDGNTNPTQGIIRVVVTGNVKCLPTI